MNNIKGFSLVELMVAVGIVGTISAIAVPKYQVHKVNASQSEAKSNLSSIYTLEQLYYTDNDHYGGKTQIAFNPGEGSKYYYSILPGTLSFTRSITVNNPMTSHGVNIPGTGGSVYFKGVAGAKQVLGSCAPSDGTAVDQWCVNHEKWMGNDPAAGTIGEPCVAADIKKGGC